jgi:DNA-binding CsgD family transcriptional regulator
MAVEAADEARTALDELAAVARRAGSRVGAGVVALLRARWEHEFGDLEAAADAARSALEIEIQASLLRHGPSTPVRVALAAALFDAGDIDGAERALAGAHTPERGIPICGFHTLRARILLARGRAAEALEDVRRQIALEQRRGWVQTFREYTRATLVTALAEAGHIEEALQTADQALETARERGLAAGESRLLIARARLAIAREDELAYLEAAVAAARRSRSALNQAEALGALGAALRRAGRRTDAREPLREARELAVRAGAKGLEQRVHEELVIAGARPQRIAQAGVDGLTPSERRVSELAATGRRNREIADELFVTLKTVEVHLGRAYAKLGINSRSQLASALT